MGTKIAIVSLAVASFILAKRGNAWCFPAILLAVAIDLEYLP